MWYEILPGFTIIVAAMGIPHFSAYLFNKIANGNAYRRSIQHEFGLTNYLRDRRLMDNPYKLAGLEKIPDN